MCLSNIKWYIVETRTLKSQPEIITGYKVLDIRNRRRCSPYYSFYWTLNRRMKSDRETVDWSPLEKLNDEIYNGFHFFSDADAAKSDCGVYPGRRRVGVFEILPRHVVAVGTFHGEISFVATRAKLVEVYE